MNPATNPANRNRNRSFATQQILQTAIITNPAKGKLRQIPQKVITTNPARGNKSCEKQWQ